MIYKDIFGRPDPFATVSVFGSEYGRPGMGRLVLKSASNHPELSWPYISKDVSHIVAELEEMGYKCEVSKDGYGAPLIKLVHEETKAALNEYLSGIESGYIRFGNIPPSGKSINHLTGEEEVGVSVYPANFWPDGHYEVLVPNTTSGIVGYIRGTDRRPILRVWGKVVGTGSDGEPLLEVEKWVILEK